jgi:hypothetical protein
MGLLARVPVDANYVRDLLPALVVCGVGIGLAFVTMSIGALEGVEDRNSGLASGLVNTTQQIGGALGVALLSTIALSRSEDVLAADPTLSPTAALTEGFGDALLAAGALAVVGALLAAVLIRSSAPATTAASEMRGQLGYWRAEAIGPADSDRIEVRELLRDTAERDID